MKEATLTETTDRSGTWTPILSGEESTRAFEAIDAVLADFANAREPDSDAPAFRRSLSLASDCALLHAWHAAALASEESRQACSASLDLAIELLEHTPVPPWLYGGYAGLALTLHQVECLDENPDLEDETANDANDEVDTELIALLSSDSWTESYDLVSGLVGLGAYFANRLPRASGVEGLRRVVDLLERSVVEDADGFAWYTPPSLLWDWQLEFAPKGFYNLGVAHGIPGVAVILALAAAADIRGARATELLEGTVHWLAAQKLPAEPGSGLFPSWNVPDRIPSPSRLAWCYGDAGIGAALLWTAQLMDRPDWKAEAIAILHHAARRPEDDSGVKDPGLCHGAAGLGHIFNRAYQATGDPVLRTAAQEWFARTLEMRDPALGYGGFWAYEPYELVSNEEIRDAASAIRPSPDLLSGSAGIALALLAATTEVPPDWDWRMLLSLPPADPASKKTLG